VLDPQRQKQIGVTAQISRRLVMEDKKKWERNITFLRENAYYFIILYFEVSGYHARLIFS
jgi:hypothetical protein